jgi:hypothetical protein
MRQRQLLVVLVGLWLLIAGTLIGLQLHGLPQTIDTTRGEATIHFSADRTWRLLADSCITVNWQVDRTHAVYLNGDGKVGSGEETLCSINNATLTVDFQDGTSQDYTLAATPFLATIAGWGVLLIITVLTYTILALLNWMPEPRRILTSIQQIPRQLITSVRDFFRHEDRVQIALFIFVMLLGIGLRLLYVDGAIRYDEAGSLSDYVLVDNVFDSLSRYDRPNNHLLNTLLMYVSMRGFGTIDEWVLRLPNFIAGIVTILLTYIAARQRFDKNTALLAAGLVAVSSAMITYSAMARGYMLQIAFFMGLVIMSQQLVKQRTIAAWIGFIICTALGFYSVLTMLYGFAGVALWLLLTIVLQRDWNRLRESIIGMGWAGWFTLLLYMPVLTRFGLGAITSNSYTSPLAWDNFFAQLSRTLENISNFWLGGIPQIGWIVILVALIIGVVRSFVLTSKTGAHTGTPLRNAAKNPLLPIVLLTTIAIVIIQHPALYAAPHIFLFLLPQLAIATAAGFGSILEKTRFPQIGILVIVCLIAGGTVVSRAPFLTYEGGVYHDAESVAAYLAQQENPNFRLAFSPNYDEQIKYYFRRYAIPLERMSRDYETVDVIYFIVRHQFDPSMERIMGDLVGEAAAQFTPPESVASFEFSDLYRMERRN